MGGFLVSCVGILAGVLTLNVLVDPFAAAGTKLVPSAIETDRAIKLTLLERLRPGPEILIVGSSRAREAEPSVLQQLTGHTGFNAGVTGGTAADAWVFTRYAADLFPRQKRRYVWFIDVGVATNGVNPQLAADPRAQKYLQGGAQFGLDEGAGFRLDDAGTYLGTQATRASWRVLRACVIGECQSQVQFQPDGSLSRSTLNNAPGHAAKLKRSVDKLVAGVRRNPPTAGPVDTRRYAYFERAIRFMNQRGARPVIVLNPIHPRVLRELNRHGFPGRKRALAYFRDLHERLDFVLVDGQNIYSWGGAPHDFTNATHVNRRNMRRLLRHIVRQSAGALA